MLNGTKRRKDMKTKVINAEWDIISNGKKRQREIMSNVVNAEWDICNVEWEKMSTRK
jgi:hypothetical protein